MQTIRTTYHVIRLIAWMIPATILIVSPALAQTANDQDTASSDKPKDEIVELDPFTVSTKGDEGWMVRMSTMSNRVALPLLDTPGGFTVLNEEFINDLAATDVMQALKYGVSGVTEKQNISDDMNIRGFRTGASRDGLRHRVPKKSPMYDVGRVEVIKGPASLLLGENDFLGGAVNLISREPSTDRHTWLKGSVGSESYYRFELNTTGGLVEKENFTSAYRFTFGLSEGDMHREINSIDEVFYGGALSFKFNENLEIKLYGYKFKDHGYVYWDDFIDIEATAETGMGVLNPLSTKSFSVARSQDAFQDNDELYGRAELRAQITPNSNLRLAYFLLDNGDERQHIRGIQVRSDNQSIGRQFLPRSATRRTEKIQLDYHHEFTAGGFTNGFTGGYDYEHGFDRVRDQVATLADLDAANPDFSADDAFDFEGWTPRRDFRDWSDTSSWYVHDYVSFWEGRVIVSGGLRWIDVHSSFERHSDERPPDHSWNSSGSSDDPVYRVHRAGVVFKPFKEKDVSIYYANAINYYPQNGLLITNPTTGDSEPLKDQEGTLDEVGVKWIHRFGENSTVYGMVVYFEQYLTNVETRGIDPETGDDIFFQSEKDFSRGFETEFGWRQDSALGSTNLLITYFNGDSESVAEQVPLVDHPHEKISVLVKHAFADDVLKGFSFGIGFHDQAEFRNSRVGKIVTPTTYNAFAKYSWGERLSFSLNLDNFTDERYIINVSQPALVQGSYGRNIKFGVSYDF